MKVGIAIASGTLKGVFGHGVLSALETHGIKAEAYACASSSVLSGGLAAIGKANEIGVSYWLDVSEKSKEIGMSDVVLYSIEEYGKYIKQAIFDIHAPRFLIVASQVLTQEAQQLTQGDGARKLGRKLIIDAIKKDPTWVSAHLKKVIFDSKFTASDISLTENNFNEVVYASTRMLHAWERPASINRIPFVDASYTCSCPALELIEIGYRKIIIISCDPGLPYNDIFQSIALSKELLSSAQTHFVFPDYDLKSIGVDYTKATAEGIKIAYQHGYDKGEALANKLAWD